jgi:hypothetical protein
MTMRAVELKLGGTLKILMSEAVVPQAGCFVTVRYQGFTIKAKGDAMAYTLPADKQVHVQVSYVDAGGNPAAVDGDVTWDSSNETIVEIVVDAADSTKAIVRAAGKVGSAQVTAYADADLGDGVREIATTMDVTVMAGEAVAGTITPVGEPEPIPYVDPRKS